VERRLAAILAADMANYGRLIGADEEGTLLRFKAHLRELIDPTIKEHHGRIVKTTGDGALVEFVSVVDAVRCAVKIQREMVERNADSPEDKRIEFRIGINVGEIIIDDDDIFGDGVNLAVRLEGLAKPGGICVSKRVQEDAYGKVDFDFDDGGEKQLKNIASPIRIYHVRLSGPPAGGGRMLLPEKPSIAVLPFHNISGDQEQDYFADGMVDDIISALSRMRWLFVIARNSSFAYKGKATDVKQVGRELGVRYVLEGSVRKAANRVRMTGQLIDTATGAHLWADHFDGALADIFDLQDQMTASVVGAIAPKLERAEIERAKHKPTESLDAYDFYLRGVAHFHQLTKEANTEALRLFHRAIELDGEFASASGMAAWCHVWRKWNGWVSDPVREGNETERLAWRAVEVGKDDAVALCTGGFALAHVVGDLENGAAFIDQSLVLNPNLAMAWHFSGWVNVWLGEHEMAIERLGRAVRLSPLDPFTFLAQGALALAHFVAERYDAAVGCAQNSIREQPNFAPAIRILAASCAFAGRRELAEKTMTRVRQLAPALRISDVKNITPLRRADDLARYTEGLRLAGLPE